MYGNFLDAGLYIVSTVYGRGEVAGAGAGEGGSCTGQLPRPHHHSTAGSRGELGTTQGSRVCIAVGWDEVIGNDRVIQFSPYQHVAFVACV